MDELIWREEQEFFHRYALTGKYLILVRSLSGEFKGRWQGVWNPPIKVLDYIKFGVLEQGQRIWFCDTPLSFNYYLDHAIHIYKIVDLVIEEELFIFENDEILGLELRFPEAKKRFVLCVAAKFNLRIEDNRVEDRTHVKPIKNQVVIWDKEEAAVIARSREDISHVALLSSSLKPRQIVLGSLDQRFSTSRSSTGECYLEFQVQPDKQKEVRFLLGASFESLESLKKRFVQIRKNFDSAYQFKKTLYKKRLLENTAKIHSSSAEFNRVFQSAKADIENLTHYQKGMGLGILAGLPTHIIYFGRDMCWSLLGMNAVGFLDYSKESLLLLAAHQKKEGKDKGKIPHEIRPTGEVTYASVDSTSLFLMGAYDYYRWSGNKTFLEFISRNIKDAVLWLIKQAKTGFIKDRGDVGFPGTTWMDSYLRRDYPIDVQALYLRALECGWELERERGDPDFALLCRQTLLPALRQIKGFWNEKRGFFYDSLKRKGGGDETLTINPAVLLMLGFAGKRRAIKCLEKFEEDIFTNRYGVRTRATSEQGYDPLSYHKGAIWPLGTCWVASSEFRYGREDKGWDYLNRLIALMKDFTPGTIHEVLYKKEIGKRRIQKGCFLQAWSSSMLLYLIVRHLIGVRPYAHRRIIYLYPNIPPGWKYIGITNLRIGERRIDILHERVRGFKMITTIRNWGEPIWVDLQKRRVLVKEKEMLKLR